MMFQAINAPLQQRGVFLHVDSVSDDMDYDTDPGLIELNLSKMYLMIIN